MNDAVLQFALRALKPSQDEVYLAHLGQHRVQIVRDAASVYRLRAEGLQLEDISQCWRARNNRWIACSPARYLVMRRQPLVGNEWTEFAIVQREERAYIVWQWLVQATENRRGGAGGDRPRRAPAGHGGSSRGSDDV